MIELDPGLVRGSLLELATVTLGLVLVVCAVGARVASPLTRRWLAFALAGVLVVASSPLVGRMDERHDVDGLQEALRAEGLDVPRAEVARARSIVRQYGGYRSKETGDRAWSLRMDERDGTLTLYRAER